MPPKAQAWVIDYGWLMLGVGALVVAAVAYHLTFPTERHWHDGYHEARVIRTHDTSSDTGFSLTVFFELDGAGPLRASTDTLAVAQTIVQSACVERRMRATGDATYRLVMPRFCNPT